MDNLKAGYEFRCQRVSDINEHLPTLMGLAQECNTILECGVAGCVSSWALAYGLATSNAEGAKKLDCNDIHPCPLGPVPDLCRQIGIGIEAHWKNDLHLDGEWDFVFIDTWHVYGQLKRELDHFAPKTRKYIAMHDTTIDGFTSESVRSNFDIDAQMRQTGWPRIEIETGLQPAIDEFLASNSEWEKLKEYTNNNGLVILRRK